MALTIRTNTYRTLPGHFCDDQKVSRSAKALARLYSCAAKFDVTPSADCASLLFGEPAMSFTNPEHETLPRVAIILATRNRASLLRQTLPKCLEQDYPALEIHLFDDASVDGTEELIRRDFPQVVYHRNEKPLGCVRTRSVAADIVSHCKILISLDDDSWFVHRDSVSRAVDFFATYPDTALITHEIFTPWHMPLEPDPKAESREIGVFVGCGYSVDRERFIALGRFSDFFEGYVEESDLAIRIVDSPWKCRFASSIPVYHDETGIGRDRLKIVRNSVANSMLMYFIREPLWLAPFHATWMFVNNLRINLKRGQTGYVLSGLGMFLRRCHLISQHRKPVRWKSLRKYWRLQREWGAYFEDRLRSKAPRRKIQRLQ